MNEWGVVGVIVVLAGLFLTVGNPIIKLNNNVTRMNTILDMLSRDHEEDMKKNSESHDRIWKHNDRQDEKIEDHDRRILTLEYKGGS